MDTKDTMARERDWKRLDRYLAGCASHARECAPSGQLPPVAFVAPHEIDNVREYVRQLQQRCVEYAGALGGAHWSIPRRAEDDRGSLKADDGGSTDG